MKVAFTRRRLSSRAGQLGRTTLRLGVLFDEPKSRKVELQPAYTGFAAASNQWVWYRLSGRRGLYRNLSYVAIGSDAAESRGGGSRRHQGARKVSRG
jgi:hypoxanthine-guanine phosphoribosyltransferase